MVIQNAMTDNILLAHHHVRKRLIFHPQSRAAQSLLGNHVVLSHTHIFWHLYLFISVISTYYSSFSTSYQDGHEKPFERGQYQESP